MLSLPLWRLTTARRKVFEFFGSRRYSQPSLSGMAERMLELVGPGGFFVEAGGVDGFFQSNSYSLERFHGWRGILVEPIPEMHARICVNRPRAISFNCALVPDSDVLPTVEISSNHAMSSINGTAKVPRDEAGRIEVPTRTLTSILDEVAPSSWDLLSLDVEGFELEALKGLDFEKYAPTYILIECLTSEAVRETSSFLGERYKLIEKVSHRDLLFQLM